MQKSTPDQGSIVDSHVAAQTALRTKFLAQTTAWTAREVADFAQSQAKDRHATASRWVAEKRIFSISDNGIALYPSFQFEPGARKPYAQIAKILLALDADYRGWSMAMWFMAPNDWLDGIPPLAAWPDKRADVLRAAHAEREMGHGYG